MQPGKELDVHAGYTVGRVGEPFAVRVFTDRQEDFSDRSANASLIHTGAGGVMVVPAHGPWGMAWRSAHRRLLVQETLLFTLVVCL